MKLAWLGMVFVLGGCSSDVMVHTAMEVVCPPEKLPKQCVERERDTLHGKILRNAAIDYEDMQDDYFQCVESEKAWRNAYDRCVDDSVTH